MLDNKNIIMIHLQSITENKEWAISSSNDVYLRKYQIFRMVISNITRNTIVQSIMLEAQLSLLHDPFWSKISMVEYWLLHLDSSELIWKSSQQRKEKYLENVLYQVLLQVMGLCVPSNWPHFSGILEVVSFYPLQVFQPYFQRSSLEGNQRYILFSGRLFLPNLGEMRKIRNIYKKRNKDAYNYFYNICRRSSYLVTNNHLFSIFYLR